MARNERRASASEALVPRTSSLRVVANAARGCTACPLFRNATQTVFGEGPSGARVLLVGEQPGSEEDLAGRPFVGPSGRLLDAVLDAVGIDRRDTYVTNAVKHFKFERRGKRRIHDKPNQSEVTACRGWLMAELRLVRPQVIVCLGATAAQAFLGTSFRLTQHRGELLRGTGFAPYLTATYHPSAVLRMPDEARRHAARRALTDDLHRVAELLRSGTNLAGVST